MKLESHQKLSRLSEIIWVEDGSVREIKIITSDSRLDKNGRMIKGFTYVERPIYSLIIRI